MERSVGGAASALLLVGAAASWLLVSPVNPAVARDPSLIYSRARALAPGSYFIDFRARPSGYIGHTYIVYGRLDADGGVAELHYAGLIPEHDAWEGLFVPIEATVRRYKDDLKYLPTAIYRRRLNPAEYQRVASRVRYMQATEHRWHAIFQNCNSFAIDIADVLGLGRPPSLLPPSVWVGMLRAFNER
jgi:hypothetical protein